MFRRKRDKIHESSMAQAQEMEQRILKKTREMERRDPEIKSVVASLKDQARRNHFGEALEISWTAKGLG